jgi:hypothetical protein
LKSSGGLFRTMKVGGLRRTIFARYRPEAVPPVGHQSFRSRTLSRPTQVVNALRPRLVNVATSGHEATPLAVDIRQSAKAVPRGLEQPVGIIEGSRHGRERHRADER